MPDRLESFKVIPQGGLYSGDHYLRLSDQFPGAATLLINFEPSVYGGYRRINGYQKLNEDYPEVGGTNAEGPVLGVFIFYNSITGQDEIIAARKDADENSYSFYRWVALSSWVPYDLGQISRLHTDSELEVKRIRAAQADFGDGNVIMFVDGVNPLLVYDGDEWTEVTNAGDNAQLLAAPALISVFEDHVFVGGDVVKEGLMAHSAPRDPTDWDVANGAGQITMGAEVMAFRPFRDNLYVVGKNSINRVQADPTAGFLKKAVTTNVGTYFRDSLVEIGGDLLFLAPDGFRPIAGTSRIGDVEIESVSEPVKSLALEFLNRFTPDDLVSVVIPQKNQVRYFFAGPDTEPDASFGMLGALVTDNAQARWEWATTNGLRANCTASGFVNGNEFVLHGDYDGIVYRQETGNTFDGDNIVAIYQTPYFDMGETEIRKNFQRLQTFVRPEGPLSLNIAISYDWNDSGVKAPANYLREISQFANVYDSELAIYDDPSTVFGGGQRPVLQTEIQGSGRSIQATYVSVGDDSSFSIQGSVFEFGVSGRR